MVDQFELSGDEQHVLNTVAILEESGKAATPHVIAQRSGLDLGTVLAALTRLTREADLLRELEADAEVVGPHYEIKDSPAPA